MRVGLAAVGQRLTALIERQLLLVTEHGVRRAQARADITRGGLVAAVDHGDLRCGRIVLVFHARSAHDGVVGDQAEHGLVHVQLAEHLGQLLWRHAARTEQARPLPGQVDNGRLHADLARAAVDHGVDLAVRAVIVQDVLRRRGRGLAGEIRRRRGDRHTRAADERPRDGRFRAADGDGVQPGRRAARHQLAHGQNHRQRPRPEPVGQLPRGLRNVVAVARQLGRLCDMNDQRVILRPSLGLEDLGHGGLVERVRAQTVDRFRREAD